MRTLLRLEALFLVIAATVLYFHSGFGGVRFAALLLVPDLSLLGYLGGPKIGAIAYNTAHSSIGPLALAAVSFVLAPSLLPYALIWLAHIGMDRALGYGLKYESGFQLTHLGTVGTTTTTAGR